MLLKVSTQVEYDFFMADETDGISGKTGLSSFTSTLKKYGESSFSSISPTIAEVSGGWYKATLTTTHTNTKGALIPKFAASGAITWEPPEPPQVVTDLPGDTIASVSGSVGSVTGAVGSVTGAVGSVTGNVGGNVVGTVASVVGNVGGNIVGTVASVVGNVGGNVVGTVASVVGNVGGNVVGSVASVVAGVTLTAGAVQAIWDALTSALTTSGSIGRLIVDNLNATISSVYSRIGAPVGASISADIAGNKTVVDAIKLKTDLLPTNPAAMVFKKNTQKTISFFLYDSDGVLKTGATSLSATRSLDSGVFAACTNTPTEVGGGKYEIVATAAELNTTRTDFKFTASSCRTTPKTVYTEV